MDKTLDKTYKDISQAQKKSKITTLLIILFVFFFTATITYAFISYYYTSHFYKNTYINGVDMSNKTVSEVKTNINRKLANYTLTIEGRGNITEKVYGYNIGLTAVFDGSLEDIIGQQKGFDWPRYLFAKKEIEIETMIDIDEELFDLNFKDLVFLDEEQLINPADAYISEYDGSSYKIIGEEKGNIIKEDILYKSIVESINLLKPTLILEDLHAYEEPEIKSDDPELVPLLNDLNEFAKAKIVYEFGEIKELVDGNRISQWLIVDEFNKVSLDSQGVRNFVDYIGKTYNSFGKTRTLETSWGPTIEVSGGDYGWWLNRGKEVEELSELILAGANTIKEPAYLQTAAQYGEDDVGDTYVEVNITAQHLYFYKEGELIVESDFVSGDLSKGYVNPTGTFPIQYKARNATLNGETYSTPVKYWMPFYGGIGFHDAKWRKEFGKDIYKEDGSHGCINLPEEVAQKMYENIERGVAVYVYELPSNLQ